MASSCHRERGTFSPQPKEQAKKAASLSQQFGSHPFPPWQHLTLSLLTHLATWKKGSDRQMGSAIEKGYKWHWESIPLLQGILPIPTSQIYLSPPILQKMLLRGS